MIQPAASVVIPAYNRLDQLRLVLDGFAVQHTEAAFEVIVVDDGSDPPAGAVVAGRDNRFQVLTQPNRGRSAALNAGLRAARGEIMIVCDADIIPSSSFVEDHLAFHRRHTAEEDTHLGEVAWGVEPPAFASLLGPRANPRMVGFSGPVPWTLWYTDNWSLKRRLVDSGIVRFDEAFQACYWEDLEIAYRLAARGIRNSATSQACGHHLQCRSVEERLEVFARSVPNLVHLARCLGDEETVVSWLAQQHTSPRFTHAGERILRRVIFSVEAVADRVSAMDSRLLGTLCISLSDAVFRCGLQRGFARRQKSVSSDADTTTVIEAAVLPHADVIRVASEALFAAGEARNAGELFDFARRMMVELDSDPGFMSRFLERATARRLPA